MLFLAKAIYSSLNFTGAKRMLVDITPDKSLVKKLGLSGYRTEQALAELVDNSIDARIDGRREDITVRLDFDGRTITVLDDGHGMDGERLADAMVIAKGAKDAGKLGRFGMGLKGACSALGERFEIATSTPGSKKWHRARYDQTEWLGDKSRGWDNFEIRETKPDPGQEDWHGTRVEVSLLTVRLYPNQVSRFRERFGVRYSPYLESGQIKIRINTVECRPSAPDLDDGHGWSALDIPLGPGQRIHGRLGLLRKRSISGQYGIHLFRNSRLIRAFEKFGFPAHPENARLVGELHMDHVPVNFNKSGFIEESAEYREALGAFKKSPALRRLLTSSQSGPQTPASVDSLMDYFGGRGPAQRLDRRMRLSDASKLLGESAGKSFTVGSGDGVPVRMRIGPAAGKPLYTIGTDAGSASLDINTESPLFRLVGNPLVLLGLAASEAEMVSRNPESAAALEERNARLEGFVREWTTAAAAEGGAARTARRDREAPVPDIYGYGLYNDLIEVHDFLKESMVAKFQFTALSTLRPYLHNVLGRAVYTVHTWPGHAEEAAGLIMDRFGDGIVAAERPGPLVIDALFNRERTRAVVAVREYAAIPGSTVASPAKAFVDLIIEKSVHDAPIRDDEPRMVLHSMLRRGLVDVDQVRRHARRVKQLRRLEQMIEAGPA